MLTDHVAQNTDNPGLSIIDLAKKKAMEQWVHELTPRCSKLAFWGADEAWRDWQQRESLLLTATNKK